MNKEIRIQDDLYAYVNQEWIDKAIIPDDKPMTGGFNTLVTEVEELMMKDFSLMNKGKLAIDNEYMKQAIALYRVALNTKKRNQDGLKPALKVLNMINKLQDMGQFNRKLKDLFINDLPLPFKMGVDVDMKDSTQHCLMLMGPTTILPDTTYYKENMAQQKEALLGVWTQMVTMLLEKTPLSKEEQTLYISDALQFDQIISTLVKSQEEWSEYTKAYNPMSLRKVSGLFKPIKLRKLLTVLFGENIPSQIIVAEPRFLEGFATLFNEQNFLLYKHWAYIKFLIGSSTYLSEELREIASLYSRTLSGVAVVPTIEKQAYNLASNMFSEPVGIYYGKKYFGEDAKKDIIEIIEEIIATYKDRVSKNDFLSLSTKEKAILKLDKIVVKAGYPDQTDQVYDKMIVNVRSSLLKNVMELEKITFLHNLEELNKPVDRTKWVMPGHMVNACYNPTSNDITFPAAILQAPFYSFKQTRSENLGGIGAVIGHEISHAFDNNGAQCDENGNLNNWWTKEDFQQFEKKTEDMIEQYDGIELPWGKVNGTLVVSENIADNGGMAVTLEIMKHMPNASYKEYFINWARIWCMKARENILKLLLQVDVHSPAVLRANMTPRNFQEWYDTFGVTKDDRMYIEPNKRIIIW